ncbi:MAG TPA: hypothetical protein VM347_16730 [Nonomuraea sp.]|nr:hypothetical protein [Nonomuraea sp.]
MLGLLGPVGQAAVLAVRVREFLLAGVGDGGELVDAGCGLGQVGADPAQLVGLVVADLLGVRQIALGPV